VTIHITSDVNAPVEQAWLERVIETTLGMEKFSAPVEVGVSFVSDDEMARHNGQYLGRDGPTDVLSFGIDSLTPGYSPPHVMGQPPIALGDVLIAPDYVRRQAEQLEQDFESELALMVVHGLLHLMGYDHEIGAEAEHMEARETQILDALGWERR